MYNFVNEGASNFGPNDLFRPKEIENYQKY